jgi:ATP-dependent DNA ligase
MLASRTRTGGFIEPCIPSRALEPPSGPDWVHEVKHDGYRLIVRRAGSAVRLFTRRGQASSVTDGSIIRRRAPFDAGALTPSGFTRWGKVFWPRRRVNRQRFGDIQSIQLRWLRLCPLS